MLLGGNGSGKSVIMSQLHPYKESFDERKNIIIDGCEGRKEIDIQSGNHKYEIIHIYSKTAQSFIKKDGIELNENGGVRTFEDIITKELGLTKDFFAIGKIGSNTKNFVEFTSTERKAYIGNFLNIDDILEKYKIVNEKYKTMKKDITAISTELSKYSEKETIENEIQLLTISNDEIDKNLAELYIQKGSLEAILNRDKEETKNQSLDSLQIKINEKTKDINDNSKIKTTLESELTNLGSADEEKEKLNLELSELQTKMSVNISERENKQLLILDTNNKLSATKIELKSLGNPDDILNLEKEISEKTIELKKLSETIKLNETAILVKELLKEKKDINKYFNKFINFTDFLEKYFKELSSTSITTNKLNIEHFFDDDFDSSFKRQVSESKKVVIEKQKLLETQIKDRAISESHLCGLSNLEKRPKECSIDSCPFIKDALLHKNAMADIVEKEKEITQTKKDIELLETKFENLQNLQKLYINFNEEYKNVQPRENQVYINFLKEKNLIEWISGSFADFQNYRQQYCDNIKNAISDINEFLALSNTIKNLKDSKAILEDSDSTVREKYLKDINDLESRLLILNTELEELNTKSISLTNEYANKKELFEKFSQYILAISKLTSAQTMLSTANSDYQKLYEKIKTIKDSENKIVNINNQIINYVNIKKSKEERLNLLNKTLNKITELSEKLKDLETNYAPLETVYNALSPTSGIPLILIKTYLDETETIANELLDIAFNGDFQIKFVTTEKEFSIQVLSKNNIKPDIKLASQGEIAITTISLSLALIEQSLGDYNILCLDEIDGPLDSSNRGNFINILQNQIEKLGIEQVFVISHNNAFDTAAMDMILLKGNTVDKENAIFMENKSILYEWEE